MNTVLTPERRAFAAIRLGVPPLARLAYQIHIPLPVTGSRFGGSAASAPAVAPAPERARANVRALAVEATNSWAFLRSERRERGRHAATRTRQLARRRLIDAGHPPFRPPRQYGLDI